MGGGRVRGRLVHQGEQSSTMHDFESQAEAATSGEDSSVPRYMYFFSGAVHTHTGRF